jgi:hypothetical protein
MWRALAAVMKITAERRSSPAIISCNVLRLPLADKEGEESGVIVGKHGGDAIEEGDDTIRMTLVGDRQIWDFGTMGPCVVSLVCGETLKRCRAIAAKDDDDEPKMNDVFGRCRFRNETCSGMSDSVTLDLIYAS